MSRWTKGARLAVVSVELLMSVTGASCTRERVQSKTDVQIHDTGWVLSHGGEFDPLADGVVSVCIGVCPRTWVSRRFQHGTVLRDLAGSLFGPKN
jgi:hypothetical protein